MFSHVVLIGVLKGCLSGCLLGSKVYLELLMDLWGFVVVCLSGSWFRV